MLNLTMAEAGTNSEKRILVVRSLRFDIKERRVMAWILDTNNGYVRYLRGRNTGIGNTLGQK